MDFLGMEIFSGLDGFTITLGGLLIICLFVFIAGFVDSVAGGGGLISLPAYLFTGMPIHFAYGCNKFSSSCGTTFATLRFMKNKSIDFKFAIMAAATSFLGSYIAAHIVLLMNEEALQKLLLILLPIATVIIFMHKNYGEENHSDEIAHNKKIFMALAIGFFIGFYDGMFGPGTGTFAIIAFSLIMKYDVRTASGNAKILNLASNYASLISFIIGGVIIYQVAIPAAICGIAGNYIGSGLAIKNGAKFIRPMIMVVLVLLVSKIAFDMLF